MIFTDILAGIDFNLVINIGFYSLIGLALIGGLIGIWKGIWKTSFKLIFIGGLIVAFIFLTPTISRAICSIDLSQFFQKSLNVNGTQVAVTTVDETLVNVLIASGYVSPTASATLYETALALAHSLVSFATFFVIMVLIFLFGWIFSALFYHALFKFFIPRKVRKRHKVRWLSFFVGTVETALVLVMMLSPLSSVAGLLAKQNDSVQKLEEKEVLTDAQYTSLLKILDAYHDSLLFKTLTLNGSAKGLDLTLVDKAVTETVNGQKISILTEADNILNVLAPLADAVRTTTDSGGQIVVEMSSLYASSAVSGMIALVKNSTVIMNLLPAVIDIALDYAAGEIEDIDLTKIDLAGIDWSDQLTAIDSCYASLYESGLISYLTSKDSEIVMDDTSIALYKKALNDFGKSDLVKKIVPFAIDLADSSLRQKGFDVFNKDRSVYTNMDWGQEFGDIIDLFKNLTDILDIDLNRLIKATEPYDFQQLIVTALKDSAQNVKLKKLVVGGQDEDKSKGFFDLQLFQDQRLDISALIEQSLASFDEIGDFVDPSAVVAATEGLSIEDWKSEVAIVLDVVPYVLDNPNLNFSGTEIDLKNEATVADLRSVIDIATSSRLLIDLLPEVVERALGNSEFGSQDFFGLRLTDFNFAVDDLKSELNRLLDIVPDALDLADKMTKVDSSKAADILNAIDLSTMKTILETFVGSEILNPSRSVDGSGKLKANVNLEKFLRGALQQDAMIEAGLVLPVDLSSIVWLDQIGTDGSIKTTGEISALIHALEVIKSEALFLLDSTEISVSDLSGRLIVSLMDAVGTSKLLNASISPLLNKSVAPLLSDLGVSINFSVVEDWSTEGKKLGALIDALNDLNDSSDASLDLGSIDWISVESVKLNALLTAFGQTGLAGISLNDSGYYIDNFGELVYQIVAKANLDSLIGTPEYYNFASCSDQDGTSNGWSWIETTDQVEITVGEEKVQRTVTTVGEIKNLTDIIGVIGANGLEGFTENTASPDVLKDLLLQINDSNVLSAMIPTVLENAVARLDSISIGNRFVSVSDLNTEYFRRSPRAEREAEIIRLLDIYEYIQVDPATGKSPINELMDINNLTDTQLDSLGRLLDDLYEVRMLQTPKAGETYSLFEQIIGAILNYSTIDRLVTGLDDSNQAYDIMMSLIHDIYGRPAAIEATAENARIINVLRSVQGLDFSAITDTSKIDPTLMDSLLHALNESRLLHAAMPGFLDEIVKAARIEDLLKAPLAEGGTSVVLHPLDTKVHLSAAAADIAFWDNEIDQMVALYRTIRDENGAIKDLSQIKIGRSSSTRLIDILSPIDQMSLFANNKEYILYNIMRTTGALLDNVGELQVRGENPKAAKIRSLIFWSGHSYSDLDQQCEILENFADLAQQYYSGNADLNDQTNREIPFDLIMGTMMYVKDKETGAEKFVRSGLMSELMNNIIYSSLVKSLQLDQPANAATRDELHALFYPEGSQYDLLNIVEARGLTGLIGMLDGKDVGTDLNKFKTILQANVPLIGPLDPTALEGYDEIQNPGYTKLMRATYQRSYSENLHAHNSKIGLLLFETYADQVKVTVNVPVTVSGVVIQHIPLTFSLKNLAEIAGFDTTASTFTFEGMVNQVIDLIDHPEKLVNYIPTV